MPADPSRRLLLVDGSSYLYRAYHALPDLRDPQGEPTGAVRGIVAMLKKLREQFPSAQGACVFDAKGKTFRDDWYPEYKATRSAMPEDLARQIAPIHEVVRMLGWPIIELPGIEADDVIGTLARAAAAEGRDVMVSTGDKDLAQLVDDRVTLINTMSNESLTPASVMDKFGVPPDRIVDYLTLVGDTVDNIPGVEKVGPKTAAKWIAEHGSLDAVIAAADSVKGVAGENLRKALDWLPMGRKLVTVKTDCDLSAALPGWPAAEGWEALAWREPEREALLDFYTRHAFREWKREMEVALAVEPVPVVDRRTSEQKERDRLVQFRASPDLERFDLKKFDWARFPSLTDSRYRRLIADRLVAAGGDALKSVGQADIEGKVAIYLLSDPRPDVLACYVGQTNRANRFGEHAVDALNPDSTASEEKLAWLRGLLSSDLHPVINILQFVNTEEAAAEEMRWIGRFELSPFHLLTNSMYDRGLSVSLVACGIQPPLQARKQGFIAQVVAFDEVYCKFTNSEVRNSMSAQGISEGYRLLTRKGVKVDSGPTELLVDAFEVLKSSCGQEVYDRAHQLVRGQYLSKEDLLVLETCVPVRYATYVPWDQRYSQKGRIKEIFEFLSQQEALAAAPSQPSPAEAAAATHYETILDREAFAAWRAHIEAAELVALDTETDSLEPMRARIVGLSFSAEPGRACYIPLAHIYPGVPDQLPLDEVLAELKPWLEDATRAKLGQNIKYDQHVFANHGITVRGYVHDTLLQSYVLEAHKPHSLESLASRHLDRKGLSYEDVAGKGAQQIPFAQVSIETATTYSGEDSEMTLAVHRALWPQLEAEPRLREVYERIELPASATLLRMERHGVLIDAAVLARQSAELATRMVALEQEAHALAGQPFNLGSPKQIGEILFGKLGLPVKKKTASGTPSTDEDVLSELAADYPLPAKLLEHRSLSKLKGTYTDKLPLMVNPDTGRVHTNYAQAVAVTGRLSSNDPNLQNIPIRTAEGRRVREAFVAPPGSVILSADYSQIELRIMAHISEDPGLLRAFAEGIDVHRATASEVFAVPVDQVSSEQRRYAKVINFGLIYGMGAFGLASNLGIEQKAAKDYIERYFARFAGVKRYMDETRASAKAKGYVETLWGRRIYLPEINGGNGPRRTGAERQAINAPMQGTAADLIKLAMVAVQAALDAQQRATKMIMQVHDELVFEVPEAELDWARTAVPALMAGVAELKVPLLAEVGVGPNWDQAH